MTNLSIRYHHSGQQLLVVLYGSLCTLDALLLKTELLEKVRTTKNICLDINNVNSIDTTGLNTLLTTQFKCNMADIGFSVKYSDEHPISQLMSLTHHSQALNTVPRHRVSA